jgi:hypothetical protein
MLVRERRPSPGGGVVDIVAHDPARTWVLAATTSLAFGGAPGPAVAAAAAAVGNMAARVIPLAVTADRVPPADLPEGALHRSWLRVRDWVQERPERGNAQGVDLVLLREAEYLLTPRVAELYRLEGLMPLVPAAVRETFAAVYFDLEALHPAPLHDLAGAPRIAFPRTGEPGVEIILADGGLHLAVAAEGGPGFAADGRPGWSRLAIASPADWTSARSWALAAAAGLLPARR